MQKRLEALNRIYEIYDEFQCNPGPGLQRKMRPLLHHQRNDDHPGRLQNGIDDLNATGKLGRHRQTDKGIEEMTTVSAPAHHQPHGRTVCGGRQNTRKRIPPTNGRTAPCLPTAFAPFTTCGLLAAGVLYLSQNCGETGSADIDDFTASVNTVFLQVIEHLDAEGCSGNLIDVLQIHGTRE